MWCVYAITCSCSASVHLGEEEGDVDLEAPKVYEPIENLDQLSERLKQFQDQYNETVRGGKMDLVFFKVM